MGRQRWQPESVEVSQESREQAVRSAEARRAASRSMGSTGPPRYEGDLAKLVEVGLPHRILRGAATRCPCCGQSSMAKRWFWLHDACRSCGFRPDRAEGFLVGAVGINTIVSMGFMLITIAVGTALTYPDIPVVPLTAASVAIAAIGPLVFLPSARMICSAFGLAMRPLDPGEAPRLAEQDSEES